MRRRIPFFVLLTAALVWIGCEEQTGPDSLQGVGPSFASGGPPPDACDVKRLPVKDYFMDKGVIREVSGLLRDLSEACAADVAPDPSAQDIGFTILSRVETERWIPPLEERAVVFDAGGRIVEGVWGAMQHAGFECSYPCSTDGPTAAQAEAALRPGGAFGVRPGAGDPDEPVYSMGDDTIERWGVEPDDAEWPDDADWVDVLPADHVLVYGSPGPLPGLGDDPLGGGFDWSVTPWYSDPWTPELETALLLVGTCAVPTNTALISHRRGIVEALLPRGSQPSYCFDEDPLLAVGLARQVTRVASMLLPFWPQTLNASVAVGVSGSGKAREFSPFNGYDTSPDAAVSISQPYGGPTPAGKPICFNPPECSPLTVSWTTQGLSPLVTRETLVVFTRDNNGAKVDFGGDFTSVSGAACDPSARNEIKCVCDAREGIENCTGLALANLTLNKPGGYEICVESREDPYSSGLYIAACTETFHISPH